MCRLQLRAKGFKKALEETKSAKPGLSAFAKKEVGEGGKGGRGGVVYAL